MKSLQAAGWSKIDGALGRARAPRRPYQLQLLSVPADGEPAARGDRRRPSATPGPTLGFEVTLVEKPAADLAPRPAWRDFTAAVVDIVMGLEPDLYPLLASSQVARPGSNLAGYQDADAGPAAGGRAQARHARADRIDRVEGAAGRTRDPDADAAARLERRSPCSPTGSTGSRRRLISDTGDRYWDVLAWRLAADR